MRKICWEESVHIMHGRDVVVTMVTGTPGQRADIQDALDRWWGPLMQMHGPRSPREKDKDLRWRIKAKTSEELRQEFLTIYVPRIRELGLVIPDPELRLDETAGTWRYTEPDWDELRTVVTNHGPMSQARLEFRRLAREETALGPRRRSSACRRRHDRARQRRRRAAGDPSSSPGRSSARRRTATRCATAGASWPPTPSWPSTTPASCSGAARRASGCGSCAAADVLDLDDPDLLQPPLDRSFKKPGGYVMRDKLAAAREAAGQAEAEGTRPR